MLSISFLVENDFSASAIASITEVFYLASRHAHLNPIETHFVSMRGGVRRSRAGMTVETRPVSSASSEVLVIAVEDLSGAELTFFEHYFFEFPSDFKHFGIAGSSARLLRHIRCAPRRIAGHWHDANWIAYEVPNTQVLDSSFDRCDPWFTATTPRHLGLGILSELKSEETARTVRRHLNMGPQDVRQNSFVDIATALPRTFGTVSRAIEIIESDLALISLDELAAHFETSTRSLTRKFERQLGMTLAAYIRLRRVIKAAEMIALGHRIADAREKCGFQSSTGFANTFKRLMGVTPSVYAVMFNAPETAEAAEIRRIREKYGW